MLLFNDTNCDSSVRAFLDRVYTGAVLEAPLRKAETVEDAGGGGVNKGRIPLSLEVHDIL